MPPPPPRRLANPAAGLPGSKSPHAAPSTPSLMSLRGIDPVGIARGHHLAVFIGSCSVPDVGSCCVCVCARATYAMQTQVSAASPRPPAPRTPLRPKVTASNVVPNLLSRLTMAAVSQTVAARLCVGKGGTCLLVVGLALLWLAMAWSPDPSARHPQPTAIPTCQADPVRSPFRAGNKLADTEAPQKTSSPVRPVVPLF